MSPTYINTKMLLYLETFSEFVLTARGSVWKQNIENVYKLLFLFFIHKAFLFMLNITELICFFCAYLRFLYQHILSCFIFKMLYN